MAATQVTAGTTIASVPLTTIFTPPPACATLNLTASPYGSKGYRFYQDFFWFDNTTNHNPTPSSSTSCYPPSYTFRSAFSPGLYCPAGFTSYDQSTGSSHTSGTDVEITKFCCPSGYYRNPSFGCLSTFESATTISSIVSWSTSGYTIAQLTSPVTPTPTSVIYVFFPSIELHYKSADLLSSGSTISSGSFTTPTKSSGGFTSPAIPSGNLTKPTSSGLSTGAKAGIGVGSAIGALFLLSIIALFLRRRRKSTFEPVPELETKHEATEADGNARAELVASDVFPSHELRGPLPEGESEGDHAESPDSGQLTGTLTPITSSLNPLAVQYPKSSGLDRSALAARELDWIEQEENRLREQRERILAQNQK